MPRKSRIFSRATALSAFLLVACALPSPALAQTATRDSVTGTSTIVVPDVGILINSYDAQSGPLGEDPTGTVGLSFGGPLSFFDVTCLAVTGNRAVIGFSDGFFSGLVIVEDNGATGDRTSGAVVVRAPPSSSCVSTFEPRFEVIVGGITVVDASPPPPVPTEKDQCKNGGWRSFGSSFKNQGQCVAFVQRGPKP